MSLRERAYKEIRQKIVTLALQPGAVIDEAALQEELGLGRTPIREALIRLSQEQLVNVVPRRGTFVTNIGIADLQQLSEVRVELEGLAARLAAERGAAHHWQRMEAVLSSVPAKEDGRDTEMDLLMSIDQICHEIIYEAADNRFLEDTLNTLYALSLRLWYFSLHKMGGVPDAVRDHLAIMRALQAGDGEEAGRLMQRHIRAFQERIQASMMGARR